MEKRVLIAMILSFLVLVFWSYIFPPQPPRQNNEPQQNETPQKVDLDTSKKTEEEKTRVISESSAKPLVLPDKNITVETPLYRLVISSDGPCFKKFELKNYFTTIEKKELVDVVKLFKEKTEHLKWLLELSQASEISVKVNKENIKLEKQDQSSELTLTYLIKDNPLIEYTFVFYPDSYKIDVTNKLLYQPPGNLGLQLHMAGTRNQQNKYGTHSGFALYKDKHLSEITFGKDKKEQDIKTKLGFFALESSYFVTALVLNTDLDLSGKVIEEEKELVSTLKLIDLNSRKDNAITYSLYIGPKDLDALGKADPKLQELVNFGWTNFIAKPLLLGMKFCNNYVKNYGISIIILTIFVKILFWPLSNKSYKSMKEMQKLQPLMMKIREKYKDNKELMNKELMQLYRTYKINPMSGCLPMIVQIPVFFALYKVLSASIELRHSPFMLWIKDLSAPDRLFEFSFAIPLMDPPYGIPVLTLLMGASMFIQQKMTPPQGDPTQAKVMMLLPLIFTFMFINFPSGLVLYWFVNNILSIGQQYYIQKKLS